jgi:hypothetical protein
MSIPWLIVGCTGLALQLVVIYLMTKGFYRKYPWVFLYLLTLFLTGVADFAGGIDSLSWNTWYGGVYYINNTLRHFSGFVAVVSLYLVATSQLPNRGRLRSRVILAATGLIGLACLWEYVSTDVVHHNLSRYLGLVGRDMAFITALLILTLWFALIGVRNRDYVLFLVSSGMGLNMTGEAIGQSILELSQGRVYTIASLISIGSHLLCLLIWVRALRLAAKRSAATRVATSQ